MNIHIQISFVGGTTLELEADSFMVDMTGRVLACVCGADNYAFPLENLKSWKMTKKGALQ